MKTLLFSICAGIGIFLAPYASAQTKTTLIYNGPAASKFDVVFMGDGFTAAQQTEFNTLVDNYFKAMFTHDNGSLDNVLSELKDAFNVYRVNVNSTDGGVTQYTCSASGCGANTPVSRSTAFDMQFSGCWDCCWMSKSGTTDAKIDAALTAVGLAGADYVVMILNESGFGGCSYGKVLSITKTMSNNVLFHELGHSVGGLADEYVARTECYSGAEPGARNASKDKATPKWNLFARTPITTGNPTEYDVSENGDFEGAVYRSNCIYRPSANSTMRGNTNLHNPPSYDEFWVKNKPRSNYNFDKVYIGDFGGSNYSDVLLHYGNHLALYLVGAPDGFTGDGTATRLASSQMTVKEIKGPGGTWYVSTTDRYHVGDFSGDGVDDIVAFYPNGAYSRLGMLKAVAGGFECVQKYYYNLPGWAMRSDDQYYLADFDGDGKKDIYVFNPANWSMGYLGMLKSTGSALSFTRRYDKYLPGNYMTNYDKIQIADFDGDNKEEFVLFKSNTQTTRVYISTGAALALIAEYFGSLPGWTSKANDQYLIADFNADGKDDLYVFNGKDWGPEYMLLLKSNGSSYDYVIRYDDALPNWNMNDNDQYYVADIDGNNKEDLYVYNPKDWSTEWIGTALSSGSGLSVATKQSDWIGGWNMGLIDKLIVDNRKSGRDNLYIHNSVWFGYMWPGASGLYLRSMYKDYIHAFKHHDYGWY